ncbi:MAG: GIY-YIG nuclease family protein, partial [Myxococcales bacterium]|nr:GIY-YIG nuclease family protein [Myxococcales bacterium]
KKYLSIVFMFYVHFLKSIMYPSKIYVGYTSDVEQRLSMHNNGKSTYTAKYMPWALQGYVAFNEESKAIAFEKYLKSGSGKAFAQNHFL